MISDGAFKFMALVMLLTGVFTGTGWFGAPIIPFDRLAVVLGYFNGAVLIFLYTEITKERRK